MTDMARRTHAPQGWSFQQGLYTRFPAASHWRRRSILHGDTCHIFREFVPAIRNETSWPEFRNTDREMEQWAQWWTNDRTFTLDYATLLETRHLRFGGLRGFLTDYVTCKDDIYLWQRELGFFPNDMDLWVLGMTGNPNDIAIRRQEFDQMVENSAVATEQGALRGLEWGASFTMSIAKGDALSFPGSEQT